MKQVTATVLVNSLKPGDYFFIKKPWSQYRYWWYLAKAKRTFEINTRDFEGPYLEGFYSWEIGQGYTFTGNNVKSVQTIVPLKSREFYIPTEEEVRPFREYLDGKAQAKKAKALGERELKQYIKEILKQDTIVIPEVGMGEDFILKSARHQVDLENKAVVLMLNTKISSLSLDSLQIVENSLRESSKGKEWQYRFMTLVPRVYSKGGFPSAAFKLKVYLE